MTISSLLLDEVLAQYQLDPDGLHGPNHWRRVQENALSAAAAYGIDPTVPTLFAILHDSRRLNDDHDPQHGLRAAEFAKELRGRAFDLSDRSFDLLYKACKFHSLPVRVSNPVIQCCWDADRLDIGRCGIALDCDFLGEPTARDAVLCRTAHARARRHFAVLTKHRTSTLSV